MIRHSLAAFALLAGTATAANRYVPPPAPPINEGTPIKVERESSGDGYIIHMERATAADFRQFVGDYVVHLACSGAQHFNADLSPRTSPLGATTEELVFLSLPPGQEKDCQLTVVDRSKFPWERVFKGSIASIPEIAD